MAEKEISAIEQLEKEYPEIAKEYKKILKEQYELFSKKMLDYGLDNITMGTRLETQDEKKLSLTAVWIRMNDKMNRLKNLVLLGKENRVTDESTTDSYRDITNYGIIAQIVQNGMWKK
jgi:hypothetical protein